MFSGEDLAFLDSDLAHSSSSIQEQTEQSLLPSVFVNPHAIAFSLAGDAVYLFRRSEDVYPDRNRGLLSAISLTSSPNTFDRPGLTFHSILPLSAQEFAFVKWVKPESGDPSPKYVEYVATHGQIRQRSNDTVEEQQIVHSEGLFEKTYKPLWTYYERQRLNDVKLSTDLSFAYCPWASFARTSAAITNVCPDVQRQSRVVLRHFGKHPCGT